MVARVHGCGTPITATIRAGTPEGFSLENAGGSHCDALRSAQRSRLLRNSPFPLVLALSFGAIPLARRTPRTIGRSLVSEDPLKQSVEDAHPPPPDHPAPRFAVASRTMSSSDAATFFTNSASGTLATPSARRHSTYRRHRVLIAFTALTPEEAERAMRLDYIAIPRRTRSFSIASCIS